MENVFFLLGAYALIFLAVNAINNLRDGLKMTFLTSVVRKTLNSRSGFQNFKLGAMTMLMEGDSMRAASALIGFSNGRIIDQSQTAQALIASCVSKCFWVWIACLLSICPSVFEMSWVTLVIIGSMIVIWNVSYGMDTFGYTLIYIGVLLLGVMFSLGSVATMSGISFSFLSYTVFSDVVGVVLSGFAGILWGVLLSGNLLSVFLVLPFVIYGFVGVESATAFVVGSEVGTLFPMSMMVADTTLRSRRAFLFLSLVVAITWAVDIVILSIFDLSFLSSLGAIGLAISYTVLFGVMLIVVYYLSGVKLWTRVSGVSKENPVNSKRHLHRFEKTCSPHVSVLLLQAEREIVNLQFRIHKMLDFTIDLVDNENAEASMDHIRKYKDIVIRTTKEITDFIVTQTSMKNNVYVSDFAMERLHAVDLQCQIGSLFCDMAEAICRSDASKYPIIRRCVVALETLYNQATKLINSRFASHSADGSVLKDDVEELSVQLTQLLNEFGGDPVCDVLPYSFERSRKIILDIIENLK